MAKKPTAKACADLAMAELEGDLIPYMLGKESLDGRGADCQGLVEAVVRALGGTISYRGSNDMFRNACTYVATLDQAKVEGRLVPGAVLFIVRLDGGEPPQYKDGKGNASHVGWYTGGRYEVVHASSSRGKVAASTLKNAWTHVGWLKSVDYGYEQVEGAQDLEPIALGSRGERVKEIQLLLQGLGYDIGSRTGADGIFGKATQAAVEQYQRDRDLPVTGVWDEKAQAAVTDATGEQAEELTESSVAQRLGEIALELAQIASQLS